MAKSGSASEPAPRLLRIPEVAERLGIGRATVYTLIASQQLAVHDIGTGTRTRLRVSEPDLAAYITSRRIPPLKSPRTATRK